MYSLECYDNAIKQSGGAKDVVTPASKDVRKEAFKYNHVTYYQYLENTGRQLNKMRIFEDNSQVAQIQHQNAINDFTVEERNVSDSHA